MRWTKAPGLDHDVFGFSSSAAMAVSHWSCKRTSCSRSPPSPRAAKAATRCLQSPSPSRVSTRMTSMSVSVLRYTDWVSVSSSSGEMPPGKPAPGGVAVKSAFAQYTQPCSVTETSFSCHFEVQLDWRTLCVSGPAKTSRSLSGWKLEFWLVFGETEDL